MTTLTNDYADRVYAGVLGKVIGVYLGRPFEGWTYERIQKELGDIENYVHDKLDVPLIVTDDDISGTFTFLRALEDHGNNPDITAKEIGESWLNYLIKEKTILWWGGLGNSTEHTAYIRLANGIDAPASGSMELNGKVVAEQIGAQIFIDGWAMVAPGNPDLAVKFADAAARVSHDGEAVYGAVVMAAMESMAFVESDIDKIIDKALTYIPTDSVIATMIGELREWYAKEKDWRATREMLAASYGYDKYGGNCHMVPNHGLIIHSLLHGEGDFSETMKIVNTCGWDTDCNSGNVGCLMGILVGTEGIDAGLQKGVDWRGPVADRIYNPTADGGRAISDCGREATYIVNMGHALAGQEPYKPKDGAQFHFTFPGSVQGFQVQSGDAEVTNESGGSLCIDGKAGARIGSPVFIPSKEIGEFFDKRGYKLLAAPQIYPGQTVSAETSAPGAGLYLSYYGENDEIGYFDSDELTLTVPELPGPIKEVGVRLKDDVKLELDHLKWTGTPEFTFEKPDHKGTMWGRTWVDANDQGYGWWWWPNETFRLLQNEGLGMVSQGTREWVDYEMQADVIPHLANRAGIAARVQGMTRFYALLITADQKAQLVRRCHGETVLAEAPFEWTLGQSVQMSLTVNGNAIIGTIDGGPTFEVKDDNLDSGGIGLIIEEGRSATKKVQLRRAS
ncbi:MAG: ADP-ribosylglycohydrolase family protein [Pseudomonadota bacterium]